MVSVANRITQLFKCNAVSFTDKKAELAKGLEQDKIILEIIELKRELIAARSHFDFQTNFELIDADIFHLNSLEARYNYLIKLAKTDNIQAFHA